MHRKGKEQDRGYDFVHQQTEHFESMRRGDAWTGHILGIVNDQFGLTKKQVGKPYCKCMCAGSNEAKTFSMLSVQTCTGITGTNCGFINNICKNSMLAEQEMLDKMLLKAIADVLHEQDSTRPLNKPWLN